MNWFFFLAEKLKIQSISLVHLSGNMIFVFGAFHRIAAGFVMLASKKKIYACSLNEKYIRKKCESTWKWLLSLLVLWSVCEKWMQTTARTPTTECIMSNNVCSTHTHTHLSSTLSLSLFIRSSTQCNAIKIVKLQIKIN